MGEGLLHLVSSSSLNASEVTILFESYPNYDFELVGNVNLLTLIIVHKNVVE